MSPWADRSAATALGCAPLKHAKGVPPERYAIGGVQIAAREPNIREHMIVELDKPRELLAGDNDLAGASRQRRCGLGHGAGVRSIAPCQQSSLPEIAESHLHLVKVRMLAATHPFVFGAQKGDFIGLPRL